MADHTVVVNLVPKTVAGDLTALAALVDAEAGTDSVAVDPGIDKVASIVLTVSDAVLATAEGVVTAVLAAVTGVAEFSRYTESDPVLSSPANETLDVSDANVEDVEWTATLSEGAKIASIALTATDLTGVNIPVSIVSGDPQGHESQKRQDNKVVVRIGPSPAGGTVGSPHDLTLQVTDTNGRTSAADTVSVAVQA